MTVYVDPLMRCELTQQWPYSTHCHLVAHSNTPGALFEIDELHVFAVELKLGSGWFQNRPRCPHYNLMVNKRREAVRLGAIECDWGDMRRWLGYELDAAKKDKKGGRDE